MPARLARSPFDCSDPLGCGVPLRLRARFYPMGFAAELSTNSRAVLAAAADVWAGLPQLSKAPPVHMRVAVAGSHTGPLPPARFRGQSHLVTAVASPENFAVADVARGFAFGWLTEEAAADTAWVRYYFLEPLVCLMIDARHLAPLHASCVALGGGAVILCGDSGAGKSSLAYACARRGWKYLSDDAVHVVRANADCTVAGRPNRIRFRETAPRLFPELAAFPPVRRPNGKLDLEIETRALGIATSHRERASRIVFLDRRPRARADLRPVRAEMAWNALEQALRYGDERTRRKQGEALRRLLGLPIARLSYSDLESAEEALRELALSEG